LAERLTHPTAVVEGADLGQGTRVAAFVHVERGARTGAGCHIAEHAFLGADVVLGERVRVEPGARLVGVTVGDGAHVGSNAVIGTSEKTSRRTSVGRDARLGAHVYVAAGVQIGEQAVVEPGTVVKDDVPSLAIVTGNPARIERYVDSVAAAGGDAVAKELPSFRTVQGVKAYRMPVITDLRGTISVGEFPKTLPFTPNRYFIIYDVGSVHARGQHAHKKCEQFLVCIRGRVTVLVDDGSSREEVILDSPAVGIHVPPMTWAVQYHYSPDAMLLVLASHAYDPGDYVRDYAEFKGLLRSG
jgi:UDP-2-acetamido-3-amino-2,3-dideoxy-glucuronate N-acetyltransferase